MTITQLEYFCSVCRCGSISGAAAELFVSHPTVSVAIKSLENEFSIQLFTRTGSRVTLTRDGAAFYKQAQAILKRCDEMYADFAKRPESSYRVHIGVPPIRSTVLFPKLLADFQKKHAIPIVLHEYSTKRALERLEAGELDCCMVNVEDEVLSHYNSAALLKDHFVFIVSKDSPLSTKRFVAPKDLKDVPLIFQSSDSALNARLSDVFDSAGIQPHVILYSSQLMTILSFVRQNLGGAFLYSTMPVPAGVVPVPFRPAITSTFAIVWAKGGYINRNVRTWISFVKEECV